MYYIAQMYSNCGAKVHPWFYLKPFRPKSEQSLLLTMFWPACTLHRRRVKWGTELFISSLCHCFMICSGCWSSKHWFIQHAPPLPNKKRMSTCCHCRSSQLHHCTIWEHTTNLSSARESSTNLRIYFPGLLDTRVRYSFHSFLLVLYDPI